MKAKISLLLLVLTVLSSCQQNTASDHAVQNNTVSVSEQDALSEMAKIKKGMIKVAILYQNGEDITFDMDYYANKHMPMAADLFGDALKAMVIDQGLTGRTPDLPAKYVAVGYFYFDTLEAFQGAMGPNSPALREDVPNFTNIIPEVQVSKVQTAV